MAHLPLERYFLLDRRGPEEIDRHIVNNARSCKTAIFCPRITQRANHNLIRVIKLWKRASDRSPSSLGSTFR